jgi:hypothetical protein
VTTWHRSAFSESVLFRETLLVARKTKLKGDEKTAITVLKNLPSTLSEARETAKQITGLEEGWEDDKTVVKIHDYSELKEDVGNWFKYVAVSDLSLADLMEELLKSDKLVPLSSISKALESDLRHYKFMHFHGFVIYDKSRALKRIDSWILEKLSARLIVAKHRDLDWETKIPMKVLSRGLRRASYVDTIDVSDTSDYLILSWFEGIEDMAKAALTDKELRVFRKTGIESWQNKFKDRASHVLFSRRLDISAPGTSLTAFYSNTPVVGVDLWCIHEVEEEQAKILALWLNSTLGLLQTLILRTETRGPGMKVHDYMLSEMLVPKTNKFSDGELKQLLKTFQAVKDIRFPSILDQLRNNNPSRRLIDSAWLEALGYKGDSDKLLDRLYSSLVKEIELLKGILAEGQQPEEEDESE